MKKRSVLSFIAVMMMSAAISGCSTSAATDGKVSAEAADSENNGAAGTEADSGEYAYVIGHYGGITGSVATAGVMVIMELNYASNNGMKKAVSSEDKLNLNFTMMGQPQKAL